MKSTAYALGLLLTLTSAALSHADDRPAPRTIAVEGVGEVRVAPDEVVLNFAVSTFEKNVSASKEQNDSTTKRILSVAAAGGIKTEDVQTAELRIKVRFEKNNHGQDDFGHVAGYEMTRGVTLHLRDISKFESLLQSLVSAGVNYFSGIEFRSSELRKHRDAARDMAIVAAREKAARMAATLNEKIGRPLKIEEQSNSSWFGANSFGNQSIRYDDASNSGGESGSSFSAGRMAITARIAVVFELLN